MSTLTARKVRLCGIRMWLSLGCNQVRALEAGVGGCGGAFES